MRVHCKTWGEANFSAKMLDAGLRSGELASQSILDRRSDASDSDVTSISWPLLLHLGLCKCLRALTSLSLAQTPRWDYLCSSQKDNNKKENGAHTHT